VEYDNYKCDRNYTIQGYKGNMRNEERYGKARDAKSRLDHFDVREI